MSGGQQDIASIASMAIFWDRNYCVEFLEEMRVYCGKEDNILAGNLWSLLASTEMISVARLWSIFHVAIVIPMCWLASKTHELAEHKWGYISMGKVLDKLKDDSESTVEDPNLICDEEFMTGMMSDWARSYLFLMIFSLENLRRRQQLILLLSLTQRLFL